MKGRGVRINHDDDGVCWTIAQSSGNQVGLNGGEPISMLPIPRLVSYAKSGMYLTLGA